MNPASREKRFFTGTNSQKVIKIIDFLLIISSGLKTGIDFLDIFIDFFDWLFGCPELIILPGPTHESKIESKISPA